MRKALAVVAAVAVSLLGASEAATAHSKALEWQIAAEGTGPSRIDGNVKSELQKCVVGVPVDLVNEGGEGAVVDTEYTDIDGEFTFEGMAPGVYVARARKVFVKKRAGHKHYCPEITSDPGILIG